MPARTFLKQITSANLLILHLTVMVWGFTGILGALITTQATQLVWYRVGIAYISLFIYFKIARIRFSLARLDFFKLFFTGALVGGHWILFFQSIKSANVSVALVCLSSITLLTAIIEPLINRTRLSKLEIVTGLCIIAGIVIIFKFETRYTAGIIYGLFAAVLASLFSIINSRQIKKIKAPVISFYELLGAWFWISVYLLASGGYRKVGLLSLADGLYLLLLGTVCTSVAYVAGVAVMKELSAFRVALITNLEPVYGILLAFLFFGNKERMTTEFYTGAVIILASIFLYPVIKARAGKRRLQKQLPVG